MEILVSNSSVLAIEIIDESEKVIQFRFLLIQEVKQVAIFILHRLGLEHDGVNNNCSNDVIKGSIMAPLVRSRFDRFFWSPCSRRDLISKLK